MKILALLALVVSLAGCPKPFPPVPPTPPDADAAVPAGVSCDTACARGQALGCKWATPTPDGASCSTVCANANRQDGPARWDLSCRTHENACGDCP